MSMKTWTMLGYISLGLLLGFMLRILVEHGRRWAARRFFRPVLLRRFDPATVPQALRRELAAHGDGVAEREKA